MRIVLALILSLLATPAFAQGWDRYDNSRFGYGVDIPPGFAASDDSDNGDGQAFALAGRPTYLLVWGGHVRDGFESVVAQAMAGDQGEAWNISHQTSTPRWADYGAVKGSRMLHQRLVLLCDGQSYAAFRAEYSSVDSTDMNPVIDRLVQSLRGNC